MRARHEQLLARELARLKRRGYSLEPFRGADSAAIARGDEYSSWIHRAKAGLDQYLPSARRVSGAFAAPIPSEASLTIERAADSVQQRYAKDRQFLDEKVRRLSRYRGYRGKHVAVFEEKVIASASSADELIGKVVKEHGWGVLSRSVTQFLGTDRDEAV